jgi:glycosyltransferase involved in cell wall biosynthesis|tara:strand:- start:1481 stop:2767 length:1287 start_codon:yes stop_codon:yes gene_type:complete
VKTPAKKVLIISYYWPPAGGSGVQRWMYFAKHLKQLGWEPIVITVAVQEASYVVLDNSLLKEVADIRVIKTSTREPLKWYSLLTTRSSKKGIPQGEIKQKSLLGKLAAYIRGNYFIPDARKGWVPFALKAAQKELNKEAISHLITTGPPHSTHLIGLQLKSQFDLNWWVDFRDPWAEVFYNSDLYRTLKTIKKDLALEKQVLQTANGVLTTVGGTLHNQLKVKAPKQCFVFIPNGYDAELMENVQATKPKDVFHIVYTGLLTENQVHKSVLDALNKLSVEQPTRFSLAGIIAPEIITKIKKDLPKAEIIFYGYLSHKEAIGLMKSAHLLLNFIFTGAKTQMISGKLLEYMATAVPILSIGDPMSEAGKFIKQGSATQMIESTNSNEILAFLIKSANSKETITNEFPELKNWSRKELTKKLIDSVLKAE